MRKLRIWIARLICWTLIIASLLVLVGQWNYWLGTALHAGRWWLVGVGGLFAYFAWKNKASQRARLLGLTIALLFVEWGFHTIQYEGLQYEGLNGVEDNAKTVSLMSYNVYFKNQSPQLAIKLIQEQQPDVLLIQELTPSWHQQLVSRLGNQYPYQIAKPLKGTHGIGIYSKYRISNVEYLNNSSRLPIAQMVTLHVNGKKVLLTNLHLASPARAVEHPERFFEYMESNAHLRVAQWEKLVNKLASKKLRDQLIIGDANTLPYEPLYRTIRKSYADLHSKAGQGWGWTFPNTARIPFPFLRLDYALAKGKIKAHEMNVLEGGSSDHLPIYLQVEL